MGLLTLGVGLLLGGILGFNFGVRKTADACHEAAHKFVDALRERYGVERQRVTLAAEPIDIVLLDNDIEALAVPLFHLE